MTPAEQLALDEAAALVRRSYHEAGHVVLSRLMGVTVLSASAAADDARVRTRSRRGSERQLIAVDVAGSLSEDLVPGPRNRDAASLDRANAERRALVVVKRRNGLTADAADTDEIKRQARQLVRNIRGAVEVFVHGNRPMVEKIACALALGESHRLGQDEIDRLFI